MKIFLNSSLSTKKGKSYLNFIIFFTDNNSQEDLIKFIYHLPFLVEDWNLERFSYQVRNLLKITMFIS